MCGIVGFWQIPDRNTDWMHSTINRMSDTLIHRGPDAQGCWVDEQKGLALGHRRLSVLDLSPEGYQPMISVDERYVIVFNGEIYNFLDLKKQLEQLGHSFRGHSDTEVMLAAFCQWGIEATIPRLVGMFAFGVWDRKEDVLYLGRDRIGEKPLYYGWANNTFLFASELKAITAYPSWQTNINRDVLALFLRYNYIPAPYSIYQNVYKLLPGTFLKISSTHLRQKTLTPQYYWSAKTVAEVGTNYPFKGTEIEAVEQLDSLLKEVIRQQMIADVPLGAFLSGGIDSSTIVALMQTQSDRAIKTFTIGFYESAYNEANYAKAVAQHLGCNHTELYITPEQAIAVIPKLPILYDEPFADASQIPTFLIAQLTKQQVTVSLSGDGGDELFGGYRQYFWGEGIWRTLSKIPLAWRQTLSHLITSVSADSWNRIFERLPASPFSYFPAGDSLYRLAAVLAQKQPQDIYQHLMSQWQNPQSVVIGATEPSTVFNSPQQWAILPHFFEWMMYVDTITELSEGILTKVDRATMGVSLESRAPFLDHRVVEFAWKLPLSLKINQKKGKLILRKLLTRYIPLELIERPKQGFAIPLQDWLRSEQLRDWAESLLNEQRLGSEGYFNPQLIRQKWQEHLSGRYNWQSHLWNVLMFQAWLENIATNDKSLLNQ